MKRETVTSGKAPVILSALLILFAFTVLPAHADFYVIAAGGRGAGTEIKSLPHTISSPGFYYIKKDLTCAAETTSGITINADDVTLDLMGFSLIGSSSEEGHYGVHMFGRSNVEIRNGTVRNFRVGIFEQNAAVIGHRVINIRARGNGRSGIMLSSSGNFVEGCTAVGNGLYGILAGHGSTVGGNTCYGNGVNGIETGMGSTVTGNTCYSNTEDGIKTANTSTVTGNTCRSNNGNGIVDGGGSTVTGNTCCYNGNYGIYLEGNSLVDQNTAYSNTAGNMTSCPTCVFGTNVGAP